VACRIGTGPVRKVDLRAHRRRLTARGDAPPHFRIEEELMALSKRHEELLVVGRALDVSGEAMTDEEYRYAVGRYHRLQKIVSRQRKAKERRDAREQ